MTYKSIRNIIQNLSEKVERLESGSMSVEELESVLEDTRALHERIAILQYLSVQPVVNQSEETKVQSSFSFGVDQNVLNAMREPTNQTNLLDAIEEEKKVDDVPVVSHQLFPEETPVVVAQPVKEVEKEEQVSELSSTKEVQSINDKFSNQREVESLAQKLGKKPISNLTEAIGLNQKFLFMNDLFEGENNLYKEAINVLNNFRSFIEADEYLNVLRSKHNWDNTSSTVKSFVELIERRYS
ncbi:MAG: hypothetical protein H6598_00755 [Flavobacteriales bacterium]|nr:hypothetical protein [Flavobacteriales bacterium]